MLLLFDYYLWDLYYYWIIITTTTLFWRLSDLKPSLIDSAFLSNFSESYFYHDDFFKNSFFPVQMGKSGRKRV